MQRKKRVSNLPTLIEESVREHKGKPNSKAFVFPEISDYLLGKLLAGKEDKMREAKILEAHSLRLQLAAEEIRKNREIKVRTAIPILEKLLAEVTMNTKKAEELGVNIRNFQRNLPDDIAALKNTDPEARIKMAPSFLNFAATMHQFALQGVLGGQYKTYMKALAIAKKHAGKKLQ